MVVRRGCMHPFSLYGVLEHVSVLPRHPRFLSYRALQRCALPELFRSVPKLRLLVEIVNTAFRPVIRATLVVALHRVRDSLINSQPQAASLRASSSY